MILHKCQEPERFQYGGNSCFTSSQESNETNFMMPVAWVFKREILALLAEESGNAVKIAVILCLAS